MNIRGGGRWNHSAGEEREAKVAALRRMLDRSIKQGGEVSEEELDAALDAWEAQRGRSTHFPPPK